MIESGAVIESGWWVVAVILVIVAIAVALDPLFARRHDDPPKHVRRAWSAKRDARRGEPTDAQLERFFAEDR